jgi:Flp pilus assembly pilin Flp
MKKNNIKKSLRSNTRGVTAVEYALMAVVGVIAIAGTYETLGKGIISAGERTATKLK